MPYRSYFFLFLGILLIPFYLDPTVLQATTSTDYFDAGQKLYNAKNYAQAIEYFGAAISFDPNNMAAVQGRANCEYAQGNLQAALSDYQKVQLVRPSPQLSQLIQSIQVQVATTAPIPINQSAVFLEKRDITITTQYDVRITFGASLMTLTDFNNNNQEFNSVYQNLSPGSGLGKSFAGMVPGGVLPQLGIEVSRRFTPDFEGGLFFSYLPVGMVTDHFTVLAGSNPEYYSQDSYNITALFAGAQGRYTFSHGNFRPFVSGGIMAVPMQISFNSTDQYYNSTATPTPYETDMLNGYFTAMGFGGQVQAGLDWNIMGNLVASASVGFQIVSVSNFLGNLNRSIQGPDTGLYPANQTATLDMVQTDFGNAIVPVSNGNLARVIYSKNMYDFTPPGTPANNPTPMIVDLSGLVGTVQISFNF